MNEAPLNTVSLRLRVTAAVIIVLFAVLILLGLAVNATFVVQSNRNLDALLAGRVQLARQLARSGVGPQAWSTGSTPKACGPIWCCATGRNSVSRRGLEPRS